MTRAALAFSALLTLTLNGSVASASVTMPCDAKTVCALSLRMMSAPPARPADLAERHAARQLEQIAFVQPASGQR